MEKTITCTVCPSGCQVTAKYTCREDIVLTGNKCKRGLEYCTNECFDPKRTFTSSVRIAGSDRRMLPVRTAAPVAKDKIMELAELVRGIDVNAPVKLQQVIVPNVLDTGVDLVAAMTLDRKD